MDFVIQYETLLEDKWYPVVRYDTSHGVVHKDILDPKGRKEKVLLGKIDSWPIGTLREIGFNIENVS